MVQKQLLKVTKDTKDLQQRSLIKVISDVKFNDFNELYHRDYDKNLISKILVQIVDEDKFNDYRIGDLKDNNGFIDWDALFGEDKNSVKEEAFSEVEESSPINNDTFVMNTTANFNYSNTFNSTFNNTFNNNNNEANNYMGEVLSMVKPQSDIQSRRETVFKIKNNLPGKNLGYLNMNEEAFNKPYSHVGSVHEDNNMLGYSLNTELNNSSDNINSLKRDLRASRPTYNIINIFNSNKLEDNEEEIREKRILTEVK
jgi:hypothetical protein